ncbi:MAG: BPSS1780 family membrane protein [Ottowia sp.]|uniref:BPSS1780 family membrane protein n=1 Tax=unclassified Ottowia TaxID=2645081 RepID=UPI003C306D0E
MKLNIVPARTGIQWVRDGVRIFFKQPLALIGLFFMFIVSISVVAIIPFIGGVAALVLVPAATVGLMAATREAEAGRFPMPLILAVALRQGPQRVRAMLWLGALYAIGVLIVMGISALIDGGQFAQLYVNGGGITREMVTDPSFRTAMWVSTLLYLPLSLAFWHAPALVHWHGVPPLKSLFFSIVAVLRNTKAFLLYGMMWMAISFGAGLVLLLLSVFTGSASIASFGLMPIAIMIAAMFFSSLWFTFRDSFSAEEETPL